ncbi:MAG: cytochrome b [Pseudomonadales bacterium]|nr:cytochrome b [Pseudomonadales bacterium]
MDVTPSSSSLPNRYDSITIVLHWLTAGLIIVMFALAELWDFLPHGSAPKKAMQSLHISLGILLTLVLVVRLGWRFTQGTKIAPVTKDIKEIAAIAMQHSLYLLLVIQIVLGYLFRWAQAESFMFFGLFPVQFATLKDRALAHSLGNYHDIVGWTLIVLAGLHAAAALMHHYVLKDDVLNRMLPQRRH